MTSRGQHADCVVMSVGLTILVADVLTSYAVAAEEYACAWIALKHGEGETLSAYAITDDDLDHQQA